MIMNKTELLLNEGWKFHFGECEEAWYQGYDDRAFERVMLPHDWAVAYPFSKQYSSGTGISHRRDRLVPAAFLSARGISGESDPSGIRRCV